MRDPGPRTAARLREASERATTSDPPTATTDRADAGQTDYETWTTARLRRRAAELRIDGRATMSKTELVEALVSAQHLAEQPRP